MMLLVGGISWLKSSLPLETKPRSTEIYKDKERNGLFPTSDWMPQCTLSPTKCPGLESFIFCEDERELDVVAHACDPSTWETETVCLGPVWATE